jgi:hypothetical protein
MSLVATLPTDFQTASGSNIETVHLELNLTRLRSPSAMPSVGWSGVKHAAIGLWSSGNVLWRDESHFTIWQFDERI